MFKNYLKTTWINLKQKRAYTLVTILGISFPLIIVTTVVSFLTHITSNSYPQTNFNRVVEITNFKIDIQRGDNLWSMGTGVPYKFYDNYIKHFQSPVLSSFTHAFEVEVVHNDLNKKLRVRCSDESFWQVVDYEFIEGRSFNKSEVKNATKCIVIDESTKVYFFGDKSPINQYLQVDKRNYKIIGVVKDADITKFQTFGNIFFPVSTLNNFKQQDYLGLNGSVLVLLNNKQGEKVLEDELHNTILKFDLSQIEGCKKIEAKVVKFDFTALVKHNAILLFNYHIEENYIIPFALGLFTFFFLVLPALNLTYINISRTLERTEEVGVRKGFGSTKGEIFKQFIYENIFITIIGGVIALLLSLIILHFINESQILPGCHIQINNLAYFISVLIWLLLSLLSGILPAIKIAKVQIASALNGNLREHLTRRYKWLKNENLWLSIELCLVFVALFSIISFFSFFAINSFTPIGFNNQGVYEIRMFNKEDYFNYNPSKENEIFEHIKQNPLVSEISRLEGCMPYEGSDNFQKDLIYKDKIIKGKNLFYAKLGIGDWDFWDFKLIEGSWISNDDTLLSLCPVIINKKLKKELFGKDRAVGKQFMIENQNFIVKGVVESYKHLGKLTSESYFLFMRNLGYKLKLSGTHSRSISGYLRFKNNDIESSEKVLKWLTTKYPDYDFDIEAQEKYEKETYAKTLIPLLFILFLCLSVFLIVLFGMFGVFWYKINKRVPEIGLRKSVGASIFRIFRKVVAEAYFVTLIGIIPGIVLIMQLPLIGILDFTIPTFVLSVFMSSLIMFFFVGLFTILPARKASGIQPAIALHEE